MGIINRNKEKILYTEEMIQDVLYQHFMSPSNVKFFAENLYIYTWESDSWLMTKSNICYEFEIKISKSDFKNDFKHKSEKHSLLENKNPNLVKPNYFYFVTPENLIDESLIPNYAGLIYIIDYFPYFKIIKHAPKLTDNKFDENYLELLPKFYYNYRQWKHKTSVEKNYNKELNNMIDDYNQKPPSEKKPYSKLLEENKKLKILSSNEAKQKNFYIESYDKLSETLKTEYCINNKLISIIKQNLPDVDVDNIIKSIMDERR